MASSVSGNVRGINHMQTNISALRGVLITDHILMAPSALLVLIMMRARPYGMVPSAFRVLIMIQTHRSTTGMGVYRAMIIVRKHLFGMERIASHALRIAPEDQFGRTGNACVAIKQTLSFRTKKARNASLLSLTWLFTP